MGVPPIDKKSTVKRSAGVRPSTMKFTPVNYVLRDSWRKRSRTILSIAGLAALLLEDDPNLTPSDVSDSITDNADDIEDANYDHVSGYGRANAATIAGISAVNCYFDAEYDFEWDLDLNWDEDTILTHKVIWLAGQL